MQQGQKEAGVAVQATAVTASQVASTTAAAESSEAAKPMKALPPVPSPIESTATLRALGADKAPLELVVVFPSVKVSGNCKYFPLRVSTHTCKAFQRKH
jgi:hypothetical protein